MVWCGSVSMSACCVCVLWCDVCTLPMLHVLDGAVHAVTVKLSIVFISMCHACCHSEAISLLALVMHGCHREALSSLLARGMHDVTLKLYHLY